VRIKYQAGVLLCVVMLLGPSPKIEGQHSGRVWYGPASLCCLVWLSWLSLPFAASLVLPDWAFAALPARTAMDGQWVQNWVLVVALLAPCPRLVVC
jgi:hypothetical protein